MSAPSTGPLGHLKVVDASNSIAGQFCARLFADMGAQTLIVEPPEGSPTRRLGPFAHGAEAPENSLLFRHLNRGKQSFALDFDDAACTRRFAELAVGADVVVVDLQGADTLADALSDSASVICTVSDFGRIGPYRSWRGGEIIQQALSGVMAVTGRPDEPPLYGVGHRAAYAAGVTAFITCLAGLKALQRDGTGQQVETVVSEAAAAMAQNLLSQYSYSQTYATRSRYPGMLAQLQCSDGWLILFALRGWPRICAAFGLPELAGDDRFKTPVGLRRNWSQAMDLLRPKALERSAGALVDELQAAKVSSARALTLPELLDCDHFKARGFWRQVDGGVTPQTALGPVFNPTTPIPAPREAPTLGAGREPHWPTAAPSRKAASSSASPPLAGVRVLDFTIAWAGPMAARALAFLGAEVIKIENAAQIDSWRGPVAGMGDPDVYPARRGGPAPFNRHSWFNTQNHDKQSISLNLKDSRGRDIARRLAAKSDVALANFSPRALERLGLGYPELSLRNPRLVMVEMPAFGNTGPWAAHVGMGKTMEAAAGMASLIGYGDREPVLTGPAYLDPIGGLHGAAAVMTALVERDRTGCGQYVEVAQVEAAMHWIGEFILQAADDGDVFKPAGNHSSIAAPHDAFPCLGVDQWIVMAAYTDEHWRALAALTHCAELEGSAFETLAGRLLHRDDLKGRLAAWSVQFDKHDLAARLQAAGVPAAPVNSGGDVFRDPALRARGFVHELTHPEAGTHEYPGLAYRLGRTPGAIRRPAPCFAQHTDSVLGGLLEMSQPEIDALVGAGVVLRAPLSGK